MQRGSRSVFSSIHSEGALLPLDNLRKGVEKAINTLGGGFLAHPTNSALHQKLRSGDLSTQEYYTQVLCFVYRLIVLFVAEDRDILFHPQASEEARQRYTEYYSTARLRSLAQQDVGTRHTDLLRGLWLVMEKLGCDAGCPELGLPSLNGLLFSDKAMPDLPGCELTNHDLLECVRFLAFSGENHLRRVVDYKNLSTKELGSIYESLLEMHPHVSADAATFELKFVSGNTRKTSGSYYTPTSLIDCLLDSALEPVLTEACAKPDAKQAILNLKVCDPACGSGHFLIAAAHRIAKRLAAVRTGDEEPGPQARRAALRDVVGHCIYGVDINPMAVELCKVNLWLEALDPGKPFSFLDAHIQCGNSLLGATPALLKQGIPGGYRFGRLWADAWCAAFVWKKTGDCAYPISEEVFRNIEKHPFNIPSWMAEEIQRLARQYQFFHWHLAFPGVFRVPIGDEEPENEQAGWSGGFDMVLGNPPYIFGEHLNQRVKSFFQARYRLAKGQYDTYRLFIEKGLELIHPRGRCALVVPDTLLARDETRETRALLLREGLEQLYHCGTAFKANVSTIIFVVAKGSKSDDILCEELDGVAAQTRHQRTRKQFLLDPGHRFLLHVSNEEAVILSRVERACEPLQNLVRISRGEEIGKREVLEQGPIAIVVGEDISRYFVQQPSRFLQTIKKDAALYQSPKIIMLKTGRKCIAALDSESYVTMQSVYNVHVTTSRIAFETLLAFLNSRFVDWFVYKTFTSYKGLFPQLNQSTIQAIPIPLDIGARQDELMSLVRKMQCLYQDLKSSKEIKNEGFQSVEIEQIDSKINQIVYTLYGLTEREITIIEHNSS